VGEKKRALSPSPEEEEDYCRREAMPRPPPLPIGDYAVVVDPAPEPEKPQAAPIKKVRVYFSGQRMWGGVHHRSLIFVLVCIGSPIQTNTFTFYWYVLCLYLLHVFSLYSNFEFCTVLVLKKSIQTDTYILSIQIQTDTYKYKPIQAKKS
jgi:hypothetical protein